MGNYASQWGWVMARITLVGLALAAVLAGCSHKEPGAEKSADGPSLHADAGNPADPGKTARPVKAPAPVDNHLQQPFGDATISEPPDGWQRPPDTTMTQKSVGKLFDDVVRLWDDIRFVAPSGKRLAYRATLDTEMGTIEIALRPDIAPNHVRSFVALARAGYYDGLVFERTVHEPVEGKTDAMVDLIEAGCPMGTGDVGYGSIGYWLKPEFSNQVAHEEGTVGASHGEGTDSAACKFYINLCKAPFMDGNYTIFGKVTRGLEIARHISSMPVRRDAEYPDGDRPANPVVIRNVAIHSEETAD